MSLWCHFRLHRWRLEPDVYDDGTGYTRFDVWEKCVECDVKPKLVFSRRVESGTLTRE